MKPILTALLTALLFVISIPVLGQPYFEGKLTFRVSIVSKFEAVDTSLIRRLFGNTSVFYFKNGNYLQVFDSDSIGTEMYRRADRKIYTNKNKSDTVFWTDTRFPKSDLHNLKPSQKTDTVLGIPCKELVAYYSRMMTSYYYNPDSLKVDPEWFAGFNTLDKYFITRTMGTLFLKCKMDFGAFEIIITVEKISHQPVPDSYFEIPARAILVKEEPPADKK